MGKGVQQGVDFLAGTKIVDSSLATYCIENSAIARSKDAVIAPGPLKQAPVPPIAPPNAPEPQPYRWIKPDHTLGPRRAIVICPAVATLNDPARPVSSRPAIGIDKVR